MEISELIIVGGGTAGCMLAHELVGRFGFRVTLVETPATAARPIDRERPARWLNLLGSPEDFQFETATCPNLAGRQLRWPRGRGLGGSSRINAMIWFPPTASDLRVLSEAGGDGWSEAMLCRAVERVERLVRPEPPRWLSEASWRFLMAADVPGAEPKRYRRFNRDGRRWSAGSLLDNLPSGSHSRPSGSPSSAGSLAIIRGNVERVTWEEARGNRPAGRGSAGDGPRATGVELWDGTARHRLAAACGVILAAGVIGSPTILMRSGVGPPEQLEAAGIAVRTESPGVGGNLQDHLIMPVIFRVDPRHRFSAEATPAELARWQVIGGGPLGSNVAECGGLFEKGRFQFHVTPTHYLTFPRTGSPPAMTLGVSLTAPRSRGRISIRSATPDSPAFIEPRYLVDASDLHQTIRGIQLAREIAARAPLAGWLKEEMVPGEKRRGLEALARAVERYSQTLYHPVGTCALGRGTHHVAGGRAVVRSQGEPDSVVDGRLRVSGTRGLWVADASILPRLTTGNPSVTLLAAAVLGAERIASQLGEAP